MQLLELAQSDGLNPRKVTFIQGGEYHSSCPAYGGKDRFIIWSGKNRYFCRRCEKKGDGIQYLRDFQGLSYFEACSLIGKKCSFPQRPIKQSHTFEPKFSVCPGSLWKKKAMEFIEESNQNLFNSSYAVSLFLQRGFSPRTMKLYKVGWNPRSSWHSRKEWGLPVYEDKKLWLPKGLVLATFDLHKKDPIKLKIRRDDWGQDDAYPKYVEVSGSQQTLSYYGVEQKKPVMIVESEFDAILIQELAGDLVTCMALGGASKRPDAEAHNILSQAPLILFSLDADPAGAMAYQWWKMVYSRLKLWLAPMGKSPGEAYKKGVNIREWIIIGIN